MANKRRLFCPRLACPESPVARIVQPMTDGPASEWLTYQQAAERLGLRSPNAAAARARRGKWAKRHRNTGSAAEILVPGELLATGQTRPAEPRQPPAPTPDAPTVADAVRAAVGPLEAALEREQAATERERLDRKVLQAQSDALRVELSAAQIERAEAHGAATAERARREAAEARAADLQRQVEALEARQRRRWWQF